MPCEVRWSIAPRQTRDAAIREENVTNWVTLWLRVINTVTFIVTLTLIDIVIYIVIDIGY